MLNIYLVLGAETSLKANMFIKMIKFLNKHGQLKAVMIC